MKEETTLSVYIIIKQVSKMVILIQFCNVQKYFLKQSQNFDLARFKYMSRKISRDDIITKQIPSESLINKVFVDVIFFMKL